MTTVSLLWIGDLNQDKRMVNSSMKVSDERFRPKLIELKEGQDEIRIGRLNSTNPPNYLIESCINKRMISRNHATIERLADGGFMLYDHSMNGTYVNFKRVTGGVTLNQGDIVCFGHLNGANLKPGDTVPPFYSDLKYKVSMLSNAIFINSIFVCFLLTVCFFLRYTSVPLRILLLLLLLLLLVRLKHPQSCQQAVNVSANPAEVMRQKKFRRKTPIVIEAVKKEKFLLPNSMPKIAMKI